MTRLSPPARPRHPTEGSKVLRTHPDLRESEEGADRLIRSGAIVLFLAALALFASGCAATVTPNPVRPEGYALHRKIDEKDFKLWFAEEPDHTYSPILLTRTEIERRLEEHEYIPTAAELGLDLQTSEPLLLVIPEPLWLVEGQEISEKEREEVLFTLRERIYRYVLRQYPHPMRARYAFSPTETLTQGYRIVTLKTRITDADPGYGWIRYFVGFGAGMAQLQIEGEFLEGPHADRLLGEWSMRIVHGGYADWGLNVEVFSAPYCYKYACEEAAQRLADRLPEFLPGARPKPARDRMITDAGAR